MQLLKTIDELGPHKRKQMDESPIVLDCNSKDSDDYLCGSFNVQKDQNFLFFPYCDNIAITSFSYMFPRYETHSRKKVGGFYTIHIIDPDNKQIEICNNSMLQLFCASKTDINCRLFVVLRNILLVEHCDRIVVRSKECDFGNFKINLVPHFVEFNKT